MKKERIYISFFSGENEGAGAGGVFRENMIWDGGWNRKMHVADIKEEYHL